MKVGILYGGKSTEHEVSIRSAISVYTHIDKQEHEITLININKEGVWFLAQESDLLEGRDLTEETSNRIAIYPGSQLKIDNSKDALNLDVIFPVLHGAAGEDGSVQGLLQIANIPFVGCSLLSSSMCMDKDITKKMLENAGLKVAPGITITKSNFETLDIYDATQSLNYPLFIKPANQGSSVGVTKVDNSSTLKSSIELAFNFDNKVLIESGIEGREIEVAVIGNHEPHASIPGEVIAQNDFYSYESKYIDENGAAIMIPAQLTLEESNLIRKVAINSYKALQCEGLSRVDVFLTPEHEIIINEINTLPGFTSISMYPKLFEATGIPYPKLINQLLELAVASYEMKNSFIDDVNKL